MPKRAVELTLVGCDDSTRIDMHVTEQELEFLTRLSDLFAAASGSSCEPFLTIGDDDE